MKGELVGKDLMVAIQQWIVNRRLKNLSYSTNDKGDQVIYVTLNFEDGLNLGITLDCDDEKHSMTFVVTHKRREQ